VESRVGNGTCFTLILPIHPPNKTSSNQEMTA
jgi:hypothetical protein